MKDRKAFERVRRVIDVSLGRRGKHHVWRSIETGPCAGNGEPLFRFVPGHAGVGLGFAAEDLRYCVAWTAADIGEAPGTGEWPQPFRGAPVCDGSYAIVDGGDDHLAVKVRDVVLRLDLDELIVLADLRGVGVGLFQVSVASVSMLVDGDELSTNSPHLGARISYPGFDINRLKVRIGVLPFAVAKGTTRHLCCWAFDASDWLPRRGPGPVGLAVIVIKHGLGTTKVEVPVRVVGGC